MSTYDDKRVERLRTATGKSLGPPFDPLEVAVISAAQLHGIFVWLVVLAGLGGFRSEFVPAATRELGGRVGAMGSAHCVLFGARRVDARCAD